MTLSMHAVAGPQDTASRYLDISKIEWEETTFPGVEMKMLLNDPASGLSSMLFRLAPGAIVPDHVHNGIEQTLVLEGSFEDDEGVCTAGNFVWRPSGSRHEARAPEGAVILSMFTRPNTFFGGARFFTEDKAAAE